MYKVVKKMKLLQNELKAINKADYADIEVKYQQLKADLASIQEQVHQDHNNKELREKERATLDQFVSIKKDSFSFLQQKAKIRWMQMGDDNTAYFHRSLKIQNYKKKVIALNDMNGIWNLV
jgi:hypothetical protein